MFIAVDAGEDYDSDASRVKNQHMQHDNGDSEKGAAPFMKINPHNVASTLEWRGRVQLSQDATQATQQTAEERRGASLEIEIERIRRHYQNQERVLERAIVELEQKYEQDVKRLENLNDEENYSVAEWWEIRSDYQPTECGSDGGIIPERELKR